MNQTLNFSIPYPIEATVHYNANDEAAFIPNDEVGTGDWGSLLFGQILTGAYYDHAKSNEEIYHEYTHAVLFHLIGLKGGTGEHGAMNEGYADYFACSYAGDPYWAEWLVKNHPSDFRILNTDPTEFNYANYDIVAYPATGHPAGDIHTNGMIWSGALWDLRTVLDQQLTDELIFGGISYLTSTPTFLDGLNGIIAYDNDNINYNGIHVSIIKSIFCNRGITFPESPTNLTLSGNPGDFVTLNWNPNTECNLTGYNIYRNYNFTGYQLLTSVNANATNYVDRGIIIGNYHDPKVFYKITAMDNLGQESAASNTVFTKVGGINKGTIGNNVDNEQNGKYEFYNSYPNPFNPVTNIRFALPNQSKVLIIVYNLLGNKVTTLVNDILDQGYHTVTFNAEKFPSGIYIIRITAKNTKTHEFFNRTQKIALIK